MATVARGDPFGAARDPNNANPDRQVAESLFGGENKVGFFGGGQRVSDPMSYMLPGFAGQQQTSQDQMYRALGLEQQYQQIVPGTPEWNAQLATMSNEVAKGRMTLADFQSFLQNGTRMPIPGAMTQVAQPQDQFRAGQAGLADSLMGTIMGQTPSVAEEQLRGTTDRNIAQAHALAQGGPRNAGTARMVANQVGDINQQAVGQGALLRAGEVASAQGLLGGLLGNARGQDIGFFGAQQSAGQGWAGQGLSAAQMQLQAQIAREQQAGQNFAGAQQNAIGGKILSAAAGAISPLSSMFPSGGGGGGAAPGSQYAGYSQAPVKIGFSGGEVPGYAPGGAVDSMANDTVPALLSPGEVVLPRSVTMADDAEALAAEFVREVKRKRGIKTTKKAA